MSEWAHLPNAAMINAVIADGKARPKVWNAAWGVVLARVEDHMLGGRWFEARRAAFDVIHKLSRSDAYAAAYVETRNVLADAAHDDVRTAMHDVLLALVTWPSSTDLLALTPDALRTIIATCDGDVKHQAVLLLPAVIARNTL